MIQSIAILLIILVVIFTGCVDNDVIIVTPIPIPTSAPNDIPLSTHNHTSLSISVPSTGIVANVTNSIGMELVLIPTGEFEMGSPSNDKDRYRDEVPIHRVKIANFFYIGKYEVA